MKAKQTSLVLILGLGVSLLTPTFAEEKKEGNASNVDPQALKIIERAADYLAKASTFSVKAEVWQEYPITPGRMLQFTKLVSLQVRKPNKLHVSVSTTVPHNEIWYDGKQITLLNKKENLYGSAAAPASLDETVDLVEEKLGFVLPLDDLLVKRPFEAAKEAASGQYLGLELVLGSTAHHLAFQHETVDWQIWIQDGPKPQVVKVLITQKKEDDAPQYTALFSKWDFGTKLPDYVFSFEPPAGAHEISVQTVNATSSNKEEK